MPGKQTIRPPVALKLGEYRRELGGLSAGMVRLKLVQISPRPLRGN